MGEVRLAGDRAQGGEFRRGEAHQIIAANMGIGHCVQHGFIGGRGQWRDTSELKIFLGHCQPS